MSEHLLFHGMINRTHLEDDETNDIDRSAQHLVITRSVKKKKKEKSCNAMPIDLSKYDLPYWDWDKVEAGLDRYGVPLSESKDPSGIREYNARQRKDGSAYYDGPDIPLKSSQGPQPKSEDLPPAESSSSSAPAIAPGNGSNRPSQMSSGPSSQLDGTQQLSPQATADRGDEPVFMPSTPSYPLEKPYPKGTVSQHQR